MIRREDTERAVEILTRYQSTLQTPEEQELKASIGKVSHIFQSELFQALLDIYEFYNFMLHSAPLQTPSPETSYSRARQQHENRSQDGEWRLPTGSGDSVPGTPPRLVKVTARRTEVRASVCSLVLSSHSALPEVSLYAPPPASPASSWH